MAYEANAIIEARVEYVANGQRCMNVVHYRPSVPGVGPVRDLVAAFLVSFQQDAAGTLIRGMKRNQASDVIIDLVTAQAIWPTRYVKQETEEYAVVGDIDAAPCSAQNVQMCITKKGALGNRHNVGHFHLGGLPETSYQQGLINVGGLGARIGELLTGLEWKPEDAVNGITYTPVILNKTKVVIAGKDKYVISGSTVQEHVEFNEALRVMRRRTVGLGI